MLICSPLIGHLGLHHIGVLGLPLAGVGLGHLLGRGAVVLLICGRLNLGHSELLSSCISTPSTRVTTQSAIVSFSYSIVADPDCLWLVWDLGLVLDMCR